MPTIGTLEKARAESLTDPEVVERIKSGDTASYEIIMRRYNQRLYRVTRAILRDDAEAEDVMEDAYVRAYQHFYQFAGDALFSTWLTRIAVHETLRRLRLRNRSVQLDDTQYDEGVYEHCRNLAGSKAESLSGRTWSTLGRSSAWSSGPVPHRGHAARHRRDEHRGNCRILAGWVDELAVPVYRGREVTGFAQDDTGVDVELPDGRWLRAEYLVGCDGGRSLIRKTAGIEFPGWDPTTSWSIAEIETTAAPALGFRHDAVGTHAIRKLEDGKRVGMVLTERQVGPASEPTPRDVSEALIAAYGTDYGIHTPTWISRFTDMTRQAAAHRERRVLLAGDAAHMHPPMGGQGLNIGVQDAVNLGCKLVQVVKRTSPASLLDTYHAERHPVAARVLRNTMAHVALRHQDDRSKALGDYVSQFLSMDEPRRRLAAEMSGLDTHYDLGEGHPLLGHRMPDLDMVTANGALRVFTLPQNARPVLLNLGEPGGFNITPWADRVELIDGKYIGT